MKAADDNVSALHSGDAPVTASQMMTPGVVQIPGDITVAKAAFLMQKEQMPCLLVKDTDGQVGILTYTDIVKKVVAQGMEPQDIQVRTVVSRPVHSIEFDRPLEEASTLMAVTGVPLLIVMRQDQPVGVLRARDLVYVAKQCPVRIPATVTLHDGKHTAPKQSGTIIHLSHLTATVEGPLMLPPGASVAVSFTLPGADNQITAYGRTAAPQKDSPTAGEAPAAPSPVPLAATAGAMAPARGWTVDIQLTHLTALDQAQIRLWVAHQQDHTA